MTLPGEAESVVTFTARCACANPDAQWQETRTLAGPTAIRITCDQCIPKHTPLTPVPLRGWMSWLQQIGPNR